MQQDWQLMRRKLNHDWLKNEFSKNLDDFILRIEKNNPDVDKLQSFMSMELPTWKVQRNIFLGLLSKAEAELSPRILFARAPLNRCPTEQVSWLAPLVHALWISRYPAVNDLINEAEEAFGKADHAYWAIMANLKDNEPTNRALLQKLLPKFEIFADAIMELSRALSAFPHKVLVV